MGDVQIKLRRIETKQGLDEFIELGINEKGYLTLRIGYDEIDEEVDEWETESDALKYMLGFVPESEVLIKELRKEIGKLDTIPSYEGLNSIINW